MQILKDNIRSRILDVAKQQFELKGYSKTSMREIAVDVGVGVGNIYNYFKSKDELFHEVVRPVLYALEMLLQEHHGIQGEDIMMMRSEEYLETCINVRPAKSNSAVKTRFENVDIVTFRENTEDLYVGVEEQIDENTVISCARFFIGTFSGELYRPFNRISQSLVYGDAEKIPDDKYSYSRFYNPFAYCMDVYYV